MRMLCADRISNDTIDKAKEATRDSVEVGYSPFCDVLP